jgi:hypothetical protein
MKQSVIVICEALRDMQSGIVNYFMPIDPSKPEKAEYMLVMVRKVNVNLTHKRRYRVTFEELGDADDDENNVVELELKHWPRSA